VGPAQAVDPLTEREREVLSLLGQRLSNKEIAEIMVLSPLTVKTYTGNILGKLQVTGRREAVVRGRALGVLDLA
jgi:ATP/maltotriose-dependent transcriptional regulator MalT